MGLDEADRALMIGTLTFVAWAILLMIVRVLRDPLLDVSYETVLPLGFLVGIGRKALSAMLAMIISELFAIAVFYAFRMVSLIPIAPAIGYTFGLYVLSKRKIFLFVDR